MNCSMPGLPVHHQLLESTQTHVRCVGDAIQPSHPLSSPSPGRVVEEMKVGGFKIYFVGRIYWNYWGLDRDEGVGQSSMARGAGWGSGEEWRGAGLYLVIGLLFPGRRRWWFDCRESRLQFYVCWVWDVCVSTGGVIQPVGVVSLEPWREVWGKNYKVMSLHTNDIKARNGCHWPGRELYRA